MVRSFGTLIDEAKEKSREVTVCSSIPHLRPRAMQKKADTVNAGILAVCVGERYVTDNSPSFKLADGSVNDGYYLPNGVHFTKAGVNKVAKTAALRVKVPVDGVFRASSKEAAKPSRTPSSPSTHVSSKETTWRTTSTSKATSDPYRRNRNQTTRCYYCGDTGRVKGTCRHGRQLQCYTCQGWDHKSKICNLSRNAATMRYPMP